MVRLLWLAFVACVCVSTPAFAQRPVLLDFSMAGCGPCQQLEPTLRQLEADGFAVRRVDRDREPHLTARYGVTSFPTLIVLSGNRIAARWVGVQPYGEIRNALIAASQAKVSSIGSPAPRGRLASARTAGGGIQVGSDLGAVPDVTIPGVPNPRQAMPAAGPALPPRGPLAAVERRMIESSVRFRVRESGGSSYGTGTVIDARQGEALVLTCAHLFRDLATSSPAQPAIVVELFQADAGGAVRVAERLAGQLLSADEDNDVALVAIRPKRVPSAAPIAKSEAAVAVGQAAKSVGCSLGADPTLESSRVMTVDRYQSPPSLTTNGAPKVGRSGGGLFNERGELIGVCFGADAKVGEGFYAKLSSIYGELDKLGLQEIYRPGIPPASTLASAPPRQADPPSPQPGLARADDWPRPDVVRGQGGAAAPRQGVEGMLAGLSTTDRAAAREIARRAAESEVVCIVRPKSPGGQSEVITLDSASPELIRLLLALGKRGQPR